MFDMARFRAHCAFGVDVEMLGRDLGGVPYRYYRNHMNMNICPSSPNGPMAIGISAWVVVVAVENLTYCRVSSECHSRDTICASSWLFVNVCFLT